MRKAVLIAAVLLVLGSLVLGATVLREPIANASTPFTNVFIGNTASNPVPVHEQGTLSIAQVPVTDGGQWSSADGGKSSFFGTDNPQTATAVIVHLSAGVNEVTLTDQHADGNTYVVLRVPGSPSSEVNLAVPLLRPLTFTGFSCDGSTSSTCVVGWAGDRP